MFLSRINGKCQTNVLRRPFLLKHFLFIIYVVLMCNMQALAEIEIIPKPVTLEEKSGSFILNGQTKILCTEGALEEAKKLKDYLKPATGFDLAVKSANNPKPNTIMLKLSLSAANLGKEGYTLDVTTDGVVIVSSDKAGLFYGIQTLRQLLPVQIYGNNVSQKQWRIPCVSIKDSPSYPWRGMMLDVSRYFFNAEYVKRYMDIMAMHKLNSLQLHLVDDPGWRVQIDKYPELTKKGGFRGKGAERYGGYYTKDQIRDMVKYAANLHIEIVPEIEMPAHCQSALVAYPWLGCNDKQFEMPTKCYISPEILCAGKESTYVFVENVMTEIAELFPGKFIHIGGDEAKYDRWKECPHCKKRMEQEGIETFQQLQGYLTRRIEKFLMKKGKRLIGWDEILDCGLAPNATVMTWHRPHTAVEAAKGGNNVVMALTGHAYFDAPESKLPGEPPAATWLEPISLRKAYEWEPAPAALDKDEKKYILGGQACMWTDRFMHDPILQNIPVLSENRSYRYVEYFSLPRMSALAEVVWTPQDLRNWDSFAKRQALQYKRYDAAQYHYRVPQPTVEKTAGKNNKHIITMNSQVKDAEICYTTDGSYPTVFSTRYTNPIEIDQLKNFRAITVVNERHFSLAFKFPQDKPAKSEKE